MAAMYFALPSLANYSFEGISPPMSSLGTVNEGTFGSFRRSKLLPSNVSRSLSNCRIAGESVGGLILAIRSGNPVYRSSSLLSHQQLLDIHRERFSTKRGKIPRGLRSVNKGSFFCSYLRMNIPPARIRSSRNLKSMARLGGDGDVDLYGETVDEDYYSVLGLTPDASPEEVKKAYYDCMKCCHPDLSGNSPSVNEFCMFVNEVYEVLSDPEQRMIYDEISGYTITGINPFKDATAERDHTFVDEFTCIGCKNCAHTDPQTFEIEENYGRARVMAQRRNPTLVEMAIQTCPVDCIYWVTASQLALLEDEMRIVERVNVGMMLSGMGYQSPDVFTQASWKWEKRQAKAIERARVRMMKENGKNGTEAWWNFHWGSNADENKSKASADKYAKERAAKTAAASRRWREYSRQGVYRRGIRNLPSASGLCIVEEDDVEKEKTGAI